MAFHEVVFPQDISYGSEGGPEFLTDIAVTTGGFEQRNIKWQQPRARYNVSYGVRDAQQLASLLAFFRARQGRAHGFRFKDWTDYSASNVLIGIGDGVVQQFQLVKPYMSGDVTLERIITKPVMGTVRIYLDGSEVNNGVSIDGTQGVVSFDTAPANGVQVRADFEFDVPVRFDADYLPVRLEDFGINSVTDIPLVEVRI